MPKAILAIRTYPATLLIALLLFMATLVMTAASMGTAGVGGGGDDGDGGSGIGGTGKSGEFGGSGFGGTGGPSPFITSVNDQEPITPPSVDSDLKSEIALSHALTESVEQSTLLMESSTVVASDDVQQVVESSISVPVISLPEEAPELQLAEAAPVAPEQMRATEEIDQTALNPSVDVEVFDDETLTAPVEIVQQDESNSPSDLAAESLNSAAGIESVSVKLETAAKESEQEVDRNTLPDRIQRPDLPPFQRVRPVDRASIMVPSRVQPMRI